MILMENSTYKWRKIMEISDLDKIMVWVGLAILGAGCFVSSTPLAILGFTFVYIGLAQVPGR
jgi:hypothetical protein